MLSILNRIFVNCVLGNLLFSSFLGISEKKSDKNLGNFYAPEFFATNKNKMLLLTTINIYYVRIFTNNCPPYLTITLAVPKLKFFYCPQ